MDHAEAVAQKLLERIVTGARMVYQQSQSKGEYDFDLLHPDGRVSAVEVTSSVDKTLEETRLAITSSRKGAARIRTHFCKNSWLIFPAMGVRIDRIRKEADKYLAAIESANIYGFWGPTCEHPSVEAIYTDLGVRKGLVVVGMEPGYITMAPPGAGGAVGTASVVEAVEREALKPDNRKKLCVSAKSERHLAVYVYTDSLPWVALAYFEPPAEAAHLPPEITNIWAFTERHNEGDYVVWMASALAPWKKLMVDLRP